MYVRLFLIVLLFALLAIGALREGFVVPSNEDIPQQNDGTQPWNRHPIVSVPYLQMRPAFQRGIRHHANAAYFELDNREFDIALKKAFAYSCNTLSGPWTPVVQASFTTVPKNVQNVYPAILDFLIAKINAYPPLRDIQVVHDIWTGFQTHATQQNLYLITLETILYRQGKFQGKHVSFSVMVDMSKEKPVFTVTQSRVEGVVAEDKIGMYPVVARESGTVAGHDYLPVPNDPLIPYPGRLIDAATIQQVVDTQKNNLNRNLAAQLLIV